MSRFKIPRFTGKKKPWKPGYPVPFSSRFTAWLWAKGLSVHNPFRNECTPDFSCCIRPGNEHYEMIKSIAEAAGINGDR